LEGKAPEVPELKRGCHNLDFLFQKARKDHKPDKRGKGHRGFLTLCLKFVVRNEGFSRLLFRDRRQVQVALADISSSRPT
jgi:hypothetical protein